MVQRVLDRLIPQSGLVDQEWEVHVIDDMSQMNAFVIPGYAPCSTTTAGSPLIILIGAKSSFSAASCPFVTEKTVSLRC